MGFLLPLLGIGASILGGIFQKKSADAASDAAAAQSAKEAAMERKVTTERLRQIDREEMLMREETIARTAGSGVKIDSASPLEILADQAAEFAREKAITTQVGASRASVALERGSALATQYKYQGQQGMLSGLAGAFNIASTIKWGG